ncbi:hypothetical protein PF010_g32832 [Phytophthora fragariae]|uniref:Uncharacterized protein n=1 Tax=Phytophthora fragariae TaxID=53985 RepID=A0A6G0JE20_9STRA|nr:hypothetical protein PF010_g32832 [Phytophthora fragariae]KAE9152909.1 hypothetical protein PF004_g32825 [Phytophthora fragariae]KAE9262242.1 hypothetical protein PF008_g32651 [Phytophthora fragariae]
MYSLSASVLLLVKLWCKHRLLSSHLAVAPSWATAYCKWATAWCNTCTTSRSAPDGLFRLMA